MLYFSLLKYGMLYFLIYTNIFPCSMQCRWLAFYKLIAQLEFHEKCLVLMITTVYGLNLVNHNTGYLGFVADLSFLRTWLAFSQLSSNLLMELSFGLLELSLVDCFVWKVNLICWKREYNQFYMLVNILKIYLNDLTLSIW